MGQLGFHLHYEGIVADVEPHGFAWQSGLRQHARLVEICKVATATLTHDQMIDLLRTSVNVKVIVIAPHDDGTPRRLKITHTTFTTGKTPQNYNIVMKICSQVTKFSPSLKLKPIIFCTGE